MAYEPDIPADPRIPIKPKQTKVATAGPYLIIDIKTGQPVGGQYNNPTRARTRAERMNLDWGKHRYYAKPLKLHTLDLQDMQSAPTGGDK